MARMLPPQIAPQTASPGEREIFELLRKDPATADWVVLHSLDISDHSSQVAGEADFIIIIPDKGVLCIEVKGCSTLRRHEGLWYYGTDPKPDPRGPFKQAAAAMHSLRKVAVKHSSQLAKTPFWSAVIFPYVELSTPSPEWHSWQVIDRRTFNSKPLGLQLLAVIDRARAHMATHTAWFSEKTPNPTRAHMDLFVGALRPSFESFEGPLSRARRRDSELKYYTEEQFQALDALNGNERVLYEGPAGTGKTLLAIETARRAANAGRRVLFLCFNRLLASWLEKQIAPMSSAITCGTIHGLMVRASNQVPGAESRESDYWHTTLPALAIDSLLTTPNQQFIFDELIIDEAQDLMKSSYLDFVDLCLKNGLDAGRWRLFGDFERQAIYSAAEDLKDNRKRLTKNSSLYTLRHNCRNTPSIGSLAYMLGGLAPNYASFRRPDHGVGFELIFYRDSADQAARLAMLLQTFSKQAVPAQDIVILSTKSDSNCVAADLANNSHRGRLTPLREVSTGRIRYGTVHAFKGLEAPIIVATDIDHVEGLEAQALFYVAVTRPLEKLVILIHESARNEVVKVMQPASLT